MDIFKVLKRMPQLAKFFINHYAPYRGANIRIDQFKLAEGYVKVRMPLTSSNRNIVGVHFGGSLYAMVDPFFMLILMHHLGRDYIVWDKAAKIEFISPGRGEVYAEFWITMAEINEIKRLAADNKPVFREYKVDVMGVNGERVAQVDKTLYIRRKKQIPN